MTIASFFYASIVVGIIGLAVMALLFYFIKRRPVDHAGAAHIAHAIQDGAMTFLKEEYRLIFIVVGAIAILLSIFTGFIGALIFVIGSCLSISTGFIGMRAATQANVRTTLAAKSGGEQEAFMMAFFGGGV